MTRNQWGKMTKAEQWIKVAQLCGWKVLSVPDDMGIMFGIDPAIDASKDECGGTRAIPDYINDLNAMHGAEEYPALRETDGTRRRYVGNLSKVTAGDPIFATASQRAEAFALTFEGENNE